MTVAGTRTQAGLASGLRSALMRLNRRLRYESADQHLTPNQLAVLGTLNHNGTLTVGALAAHEQVQPPSMTRIVSGLEELGLVQRSPDESDRRVTWINLTDDGDETIARFRRQRTAWLDRQLKALTAQERATLRAAVPVLEKISTL